VEYFKVMATFPDTDLPKLPIDTRIPAYYYEANENDFEFDTLVIERHQISIFDGIKSLSNVFYINIPDC